MIPSLFLILCADLSFEDVDKQKLFTELNLAQIKAKLDWLRVTLEKEKSSLSAMSLEDTTVKENRILLGRRFGYTLALCHNDLLSGNLLLSLPADDKAIGNGAENVKEDEQHRHNHADSQPQVLV